eukprot:3264743-Amphidinium_carterae.1
MAQPFQFTLVIQCLTGLSWMCTPGEHSAKETRLSKASNCLNLFCSQHQGGTQTAHCGLAVWTLRGSIPPTATLATSRSLWTLPSAFPSR